MIAVDIVPRGAFHVGGLGVGREVTLEHIPSDTLYAALVSAWVARDEHGPFDPPPLLITSAFPRVGTVRIYPQPYVRIHADEAVREALGKRLSGGRWCSERIFRCLITGADVTHLAVKSNFVHGVWFHPDDPPPAADSQPFWKTDEPVPHVAIDRLSNAPNLFHTGRTTYAPGCGLWFAVEYRARNAATLLERAMDYLSDAGLGGLRAIGHGGFEFTTGTMDAFETPTVGGYAVTLARYLPANPSEVAATLQARGAAYCLDTVGGWCQDDAGRPWRRRQVRLVREGSVIGWPGQVGCVADLKPDDVGRFDGHPVLRYGLAFAVAVREEALLCSTD